MFRTTKTGDGTTTDFEVGFDFIAASHIRVMQNAVLKTLNTDYYVLDVDKQSKATIRFASAPTNGHVIYFYRNTPIALPALNPQMSQVAARAALYRMQEQQSETRDLNFYINQTDTLAGTAASIVAPCDGYVELLQTVVADAAVGTGGAVTVEIDGVAVTGLSITVANSAAIGVTQQDTPTTAQSSTTQARKGQVITVTPAAAFATSGALRGFVRFQPADL